MSVLPRYCWNLVRGAPAKVTPDPAILQRASNFRKSYFAVLRILYILNYLREKFDTALANPCQKFLKTSNLRVKNIFPLTFKSLALL
jgi:hypothetical protein